MNDLDRIREIEGIFGFQLHRVEIENLFKEKPFQVNYQNGFRNYSVDEKGFVVGLSLDYCPIFLLPENYFSKFNNLQQLSFKNSYISDYSFLKELKALTLLDLSDNQISDASFLKELKALTSLDLSGNQISDASFLKELKSLTTLYLSYNQISDASFLKELRSLTTLDLSYNQISDYSFLKELRSLTTLDLSRNQISDASFLKELKSLTTLNLSYNQISDYSFLKELRSLTTLDLSWNQISDASFLKELSSLTTLNLGGNEISDGSFLKELKALTSLYLSWNQISDASFLKELKALTTLYLYNNQISDYSFLKELSSLTSLDLSGNQISDYSFLKELKSLTSIYLSRNQISDYSFLKELSSLTTLDLSNNRISDYSFLKELRSLTTLYLNSNQISDASFLKELRSLTTLNLYNNQISDASFLKELRSLTTLNLYNNQISDASFLKELKALTSLNLEDNPIKFPPLATVKKGLPAIRNYFKQIDEQGVDYIYEAKILIVGEPGAGKTTLFKKLLDNNFVPRELTEEEKSSTIGVNIKKGWKFPYTKNKKIKIKANLWDFGGQPPQYILHQYFLTERSLYILLANKREENPATFNYWFEIIGTLGKNCPVLVVLNEINYNSATKFDVSKYEREFEEISIDKKEVDFSKEDGRFKILQSEIQTKLSNLTHIGEELPASWIPIRKVLERRRNRNYIKIDDYAQICARYFIFEDESQKNLLGYLRDLGTALYYEGDNHLCNYVILNPHWVIDSLYAVLQDDTVQKNGGKFTRDFIYGLWKKDNYTTEDCQVLLDLMLKGKFEIAYQIDDKEFIVPFLLPYQTPDYKHVYNFTRNDVVQIHFKYKFMPPGILSRLIVRLNEYILQLKGEEIVWQDGVLFEAKDAIAEVIELEHQETITIKVLGEKQKNFLTFIRNKLHDIHKEWFKDRLYVNELVPCNCEVCKKSTESHYYELDELENYLAINEEKINCPKSIKEKRIQRVDIRRLLEAVYVEKTKRESKRYSQKDYGKNFDKKFEIEAENLIIIRGDNNKVFQDLQNSEVSLNKALSALEENNKDEAEELGNEIIKFLEQNIHKLNPETKTELDSAKRGEWKSKVKLAVPLVKHLGLNIETEREIKSDEIVSGIRKMLYGKQDKVLSILNAEADQKDTYFN